MNDRKPPRIDLLREDFSPDEEAWVSRYLSYADTALKMQPSPRREVTMSTSSSSEWRRSLRELMKPARNGRAA